MKIFHRSISALLLSAIISTAVIPAYAVEFSDVPSDLFSKSAIEYCVENNIASGIGGGKFAPDQKITLTQFYAMALAAFSPELLAQKDQSLDWYTAINQLVTDHGLASAYEIQSKQNTWSWVNILKATYRLEGWTSYTPEVWGEAPENLTGYTVNDVALIFSAQKNGLFNGLNISDYNAVPTRGEVAVFIYNARENTIQVPDIVKKYAVEFDDDGNDYNTSLVYETLLKLPTELLDQFYNSGWTFRVTNSDISDLYSDYKSYGSAIGITDPSRKEITAKGPMILYGTKTILHEFGHYYSYVKKTDLPNSVYENEKEDLKSFFRAYTVSSKKEAFADMFAYIYSCEFDQEKLAEFQKAAPQSYEYMMSVLKA